MNTTARKHPFNVALTGGIGSGKSAVAALFAKLGATIIDADQIARELTEKGQPALSAISQHFGPQVLNANGELNRAQLRAFIFNNVHERQWLEQLLHPLILAAMRQRAQPIPTLYYLHIIPLLAEIGTTKKSGFFDRIVVVDCAPELQAQRVMQRDSINKELAERMLASQSTRENRLAIADDIIDNNGSHLELEQQVAKLHQCYIDSLADK